MNLTLDDLPGMLNYEIIARFDAIVAERDSIARQLAYLHRRCLTGLGKACRLCYGSWVDEERAEDHHDTCPLYILLLVARRRAKEAGDAD